MERPLICLDSIVLDCSKMDLPAMLEFYQELTGYEADPYDEDALPTLRGDGIALSFYPVAHYFPPTFPSPAVGRQVHLDFYVKDLPAAIRFVRCIGGKDSPKQFDPSYHVMLDPAGHPFCLTTNGPTAGCHMDGMELPPVALRKDHP